MLTRWADFDTVLPAMDEMRRRMDRIMHGLDPDFVPFKIFDPTLGYHRALRRANTWPRIWLADKGESLEVKAEIPGLSEADVQVSLNQETLTLSGERKLEAPEGYSVHRQERPSLRFSRSFTLPSKVDVENVTAKVRDGVLVVTLPKAAEAKPRQITVLGS